MGRKVETVVAPAFCGRDANKIFVITELPAVQAEKWGWRMFLCVKGTAGFVDDAVARLGMIGVAIRGINTFLAAAVDFSVLEPLLDELFTCVRMIRDPAKLDVITEFKPLMDLEEPVTVGWLRSEVLRVHTGFSFVEVLPRLLSWVREGTSQTQDSLTG
jgi:hypothetical protein